MLITASYGPEGLCAPFRTASTAPCRNTDKGPTLCRAVVNRLAEFAVGELSNTTSTFSKCRSVNEKDFPTWPRQDLDRL